jgi:hypothetical protein
MAILVLSLTILGTLMKTPQVKAPAGGSVLIVPSVPTPTLAIALAAAVPNDEIHVAAGYFEILVGPFIWQNDLWIIADNRGPRPTLDLAGLPITIAAPRVFMWGFNIRDSVGGPNGIILAPPATNCIIMNNVMTGLPASTGILVQGATNTIALNTFSFWGICVDLSGPGCTANTVKANTFNPPYGFGIQVSLGAGLNRVYWNNLFAPTELWDANPAGSPPNFFDDTTGGGPSRTRGNFEVTWAIPPPYLIPPATNGYFDNWPLVAPIAMIPGDINLDGAVTLADLVILATNYGRVWCTLGWDPRADISAPLGMIGLSDLVTLALNYGRTL